MSARSRPDTAGRLIAAASARGIEIDREEAERWLAEAAAPRSGRGGPGQPRRVLGHRVAAAGIDRGELGRLWWMASVVAIDHRPPMLATALALSSPAVRRSLDRVPDDPHFVQRVHLRAETRADACGVLAREVRRKVVVALDGVGHRPVAVTFGTWPSDATVAAGPVKRGHAIDWAPPDLATGAIAYRRSDGSPSELRWEDAGSNPGCCRLDFVIADPQRGRLAAVSTVLFTTWEAPDRSIWPLDEFLEPYVDDMAREIGSIPLFSPHVTDLGADAVASYVKRLEAEIVHLIGDGSCGRAAPRLDSVLRLIGRHADASSVRELFDARLVAASGIADVVRDIERAADAGMTHEVDAMVAQADGLILSAASALEDRSEGRIARRLLALREAIDRPASADGPLAQAASRAIREVDDYFRRALTGIPTVAAYLDSIAARPG